MQSIDWELMRFLYEVHGTTLESIAEDNGISLSMVEYVHDKQEWKQSPAALEVRNWSDLPTAEEDLLKAVQDKMTVSSLLKQCALNPRLQTLEAIVLNKAIQSVAMLDFEDIPAASIVASLQKLGDLVDKLKASNPAIQMCNRKQQAQELQDNSIKVQIITGYSGDGSHKLIETPTTVVAESAPKQIECDQGFTQIEV